MVIDWGDIEEKLGEQLDGANDLLVSKITTADGKSKEFRSFQEIAQLQTIARNRAAQADKETNGMVSLIERDFS